MSVSYADAALAASTPRNPVTLRIAAYLGIAAAPSFAAMAVITAFPGGDRMGMICGFDPPSLGGMVPMYLLMSAFHSAPWLKLIAGRRSGACRS